jgi:hypothetical protein
MTGIKEHMEVIGADGVHVGIQKFKRPRGFEKHFTYCW